MAVIALATGCGMQEGGSTPPAQMGPGSGAAITQHVLWSVSRHSWPTDDRGLVGADMDRIAALGAKLVRTDFWWYTVEPQQDQFDQTALDYYKGYVEMAESKGLKVLVVLSNAPDWAKKLYQSGQKAAFYSKLKEYAARVAALVGDKVDYYQLWNEPNHLDFVDGQGDIALFKAAHDGLAAHDTSFKTLINMLVDSHDAPVCPSWECDFDAYMAGGARDVVDILGIDHYPGTWSVGDWGGNVLERLFALGRKHGKSVAILEMGYSTAGCPPGFNSEQGQAAWIGEQLPKLHRKVNDPAVNQGVPMVLANWFKLDDPKTSYSSCLLDAVNTIEDHFGLVRTDRTAKAAFGALRQQIAGF